MAGVISRAFTPAPAPPEPKEAYPNPLPVTELLSLIRGATFLSGLRRGDIAPPGAPNVGLFHDDTRFLSQLELRVNGETPGLLSSSMVTSDVCRVDLKASSGTTSGQNLDLPPNELHIRREQVLTDGEFFQSLEVQSFHDDELTVKVELLFDADFMDIFQVRGLLRGKSGRYFEPEIEDSSVLFYYEGLDNRARTTSLLFSPTPAKLEKRRVVWTVSLPPHGHKALCMTARMHVGAPKEEHPDGAGTVQAAAQTMHSAYLDAICEHETWRRDCTRFQSDNGIFDAMLQTCTDDFYALRMQLGGETGIAAGVPWFAALFGRDSLISSYQTLVLDPDLACGTLRLLASYQGDRTNDERDEDPGKILHERRSGEMTNTDEVAFGRSYGSVDATPLFLILAHEYVKWTDDLELIADLHRHLRAAVKWILDYGDLDGDGLIEYMRRNPKGLFNQGWKDSGDAIRHKDGSIAQPPIALIEVQGYAVRALACAAEMLRHLGDEDLAETAENRSEQLRRLIDEKFWMKEDAYYALALDAAKQQCRVEASNPGHLLFAKAVNRDRARDIAEKLVRPSLFSGWGVRTLSSEETSFNPMSYHCGSVWPHDNSLIAYGMTQYGMHGKAALILQSLYEAALRFRDYRLPELFCGFSRQPKGEPVHYPVSCSPQAWAAGTPFLLLTGLLGISPDAKAGKMSVVDPHLPPFLETLRIEHLRVAKSRVTLDFKREGERTYCNVVKVLGEPLEVSVVVKP